SPGSQSTEPARQRVTPDAYHAGENLVEQLPTGEWIERATYFEAVAVTGDGVFETLRAVSKVVLKSLACFVISRREPLEGIHRRSLRHHADPRMSSRCPSRGGPCHRCPSLC